MVVVADLYSELLTLHSLAFNSLRLESHNGLFKILPREYLPQGTGLHLIPIDNYLVEHLKGPTGRVI